MAKKGKTKRKKPETEYYEIEVDDWEVDYHFSINTLPRDLNDGVYSEYATLILTGKILSPIIEQASKARIRISTDPEMDDHWKVNPTIQSAKAIGSMVIPRGEDILEFFCSVPTRSLPFIAMAAESKKVRFVLVFGTKLKWRQGTISSVSLSTNREEECG